jgi:hypothetical protein
MKAFGEILRTHGFRNTGYDLTGFALDLDSFLDSSELFDWVEVTETGEGDCMLVARCQVREGISLDHAKEAVCRIWEESLRYREFSDYSIDESPVGFTFRFVTLAPHLGVTGRIDCARVRNPAAREPAPG